jgi:hypothetical protein
MITVAMRDGFAKSQFDGHASCEWKPVGLIVPLSVLLERLAI